MAAPRARPDRSAYLREAEAALHKAARRYAFALLFQKPADAMRLGLRTVHEERLTLEYAGRAFAEAEQVYANECAEPNLLNGSCRGANRFNEECGRPLYAYRTKPEAKTVEQAVFGVAPPPGIVVCDRLSCPLYDLPQDPAPGVVLRFAPGQPIVKDAREEATR